MEIMWCGVGQLRVRKQMSVCVSLCCYVSTLQQVAWDPCPAPAPHSSTAKETQLQGTESSFVVRLFLIIGYETRAESNIRIPLLITRREPHYVRFSEIKRKVSLVTLKVNLRNVFLPSSLCVHISTMSVNDVALSRMQTIFWLLI